MNTMMTFSVPSEVLLHVGLREGMKVGDFGAGSGHYSRAAAATVGSTGKVYAIDIQEDVLTFLRLNVPERHQHIIETVWGDIEKPGGTSLREGVLDVALITNVLFQIENRFSFLKELRRVIKPGGRLLVVDWAGSYGFGPSPERIVPEHVAEDLFIGAGWHKQKAFRAGPHHYGLLFHAPAV